MVNCSIDFVRVSVESFVVELYRNHRSHRIVSARHGLCSLGSLYRKAHLGSVATRSSTGAFSPLVVFLESYQLCHRTLV